MPVPPSRAPDVDDAFAGPELDPRVWVDHYLPQWTTPSRSRARTEFVPDGGLELRIDADQPDWRPEDAPLRVSNLQTAVFSGPVGSPVGTHRHREDGLTVRTAVGSRLLWAPVSGHVEVTLSASTDPGAMTALWLVGVEEQSPSDSGEICVAEIDASAILAARGGNADRPAPALAARTDLRPRGGRADRPAARGGRPDRPAVGVSARVGVKAHHDPGLVTDMAEVLVPVEVDRPHTWSVRWSADGVVIGCEGFVVRRVAQRLDYRLQLMLDLFEIGGPTAAATYPKRARLHRVRAWAL